ncbi:ABC transporter ATP-binding protein [Aneurinibacillus aneurinilyticus]|jgi:ABC-2 type transport system ATP-binding protein|uniref:ABC transporter ATP-binding protein n=1 Tax=Aneurinibacillus aneurinilyticus TaxID=1391 RepID=A0A848CSP1_ANEAE|nr:ABC transporter ATP-binding protein [Aneurinibacillus aneurinilyticus]MCI1694971.1 ABC transporter ATP-binding protein [Aneurinibacillus aneurinilyticus]NME98011.1 ABC transporter ATP-binding protein [Aneurinibacillus aneurinilyticus]
MIEIKELYKTFGRTVALRGITLNIPKGQVYGFVGPNGAGKTTTMSIMATLMSPTAGVVRVGGYDCKTQAKEVRRLIGYMPDFFGVYDNLTAYEYLDFHGASYGLQPQERERVILQMLELVQLTGKTNEYVDQLSRGMKQRLGLARALVHNPQVLILDEPASGLDPRARIEMREIIKTLRDAGKTIIISSHILPELAEMCDTIGIIEGGELVAEGKVQEIYEKMRAHRLLRIRLLDKHEALLSRLHDTSGIINAVRDGADIMASFSGSDAEQATLLASLLAEGYPLVSFGEMKGNLEDVFLEVTKGGGS